MNMKPLLNRESQLPADNWYEIAPAGKHPITILANAKPTTLMQVIDAAASQAMANSFTGDLLVDYDHFSMDVNHPSEAAGWIKELANRDGSLWARIEWTDNGAAAVTNKRYRYISPAWMPADCETLPGGAVRPLKLKNAGLTNDPNLKGMRPLSNREQTNTAQGENAMDYKTELIKILALAADATDEQISAALTKLAPKIEAAETTATENETLTNRNKTLETENKAFLADQVEKDLNEFAHVITNREGMKTLLMANRAEHIKTLETLLKSVKKPEAQTPLHNRAAAGNPDPVSGVNEKEVNTARAISNRAKQIQCDTPALQWPQAFNQAASEFALKG